MSIDIKPGSTNVLAIDPGNRESAYVIIDEHCRPLDIGKAPNTDLIVSLPYKQLTADRIAIEMDRIAIEMVASYGMAVGADVFETCVWIGRFAQQLGKAELVFRRDVKLHHCGTARAKDANITQALIDRFAPGQPNRGKGTKAQPGWFYGFRADIWQAYALAVYVADTAGEKAA